MKKNILLLLLTISLSSSLSANTSSNKLENVLETHEKLISTIIDNKAEKSEIFVLQSQVTSLKKQISSMKIMINNLSQTKVIENKEPSYKSKYDDKFKEYLNKRAK